MWRVLFADGHFEGEWGVGGRGWRAGGTEVELYGCLSAAALHRIPCCWILPTQRVKTFLPIWTLIQCDQSGYLHNR